MNKRQFESYKGLLRTTAVFVIVFFVTMAFLFVWKKCYNEEIVFPFYEKGHLVMGLIYALMFFLFIYVYDGMKYGYFKTTNIILSQSLAVVCTNAMIYLQISLLSARLVEILPIVILIIFEVVICIVWTMLVHLIFKQMFPPREMLLLYEEYSVDDIVRKMQLRKDRYVIAEVFNVSCEWDVLKSKIQEYDAVLIYDVHSKKRNKILKFCYSNSIRIYTTPKLSDIILSSAENIHLFDTPLLLSRNYGLSFEQKLFKRITDIIISGIAILLTWPIMLLIAIAIKLYDGGPVFFTQERCTIYGKVFKIHKFRSMITNAEELGISVPASEKDPRITPVGRWLRKTRLDELPQMFDILRGDMSVVGPRPERVEHVQKYSKDIPEFVYRLKVKGGLTGYAQIYGKYNTTAYDKLKLDLMYIQKYSLVLDFRLILMTFKVMFMNESTEGFSEEQILEIQTKEQ